MAVFLAVSFAGVSKSHGDEGAAASALERVAAHWRSRRALVRSVRYEVEGTNLQPKGTFDEDPSLPPEAKGVALADDYVGPFAGSWIIDFATSRFRSHITTEYFNVSERKFFPGEHDTVFDGREVRSHVVSVTKGRGMRFGPNQAEFEYLTLDHPVLTNWSTPILVGHGFLVPGETMAQLGKSIRTVDANKLTFHGTVVHRERECVVVRTLSTVPSSDPSKAFVELFVDLDRDGAVQRVAKFDSGMLIEAAEIEYEKTADGWYPRAWTCTEIDRSRWVPSRIVQVTVRKRELNSSITPVDFDLQPKPGMVVRNSNSNRNYRLGPGGEELPVTDYPVEAESHRWRRLAWAVFAAAAIAAVGAIALVIKRRQALRG